MPDAAELLRSGGYAGLAEDWLTYERDHEEPRVFPTGFPALDEMIDGGVKERSLSVIGGVTGGGKTPMVNALAIGLARNGARVMMMPLELGKKQTTDRLLAVLYGGSLRRLREELSVDDPSFQIFAQSALSELGALPIRVADVGRERKASVAQCFRTAARFGADVVVIDHAKELPGWNLNRAPDGLSGAESTSVSIATAVYTTKIACIIAQQLDVRRVAQLKSGERPGIGHFQDTQRLGQLADFAMIVHRPYVKERKLDHVAEGIVVKSRLGPLGTTHFEWKGPGMIYRQLDFAHEAECASICCGDEARERARHERMMKGGSK